MKSRINELSQNIKERISKPLPGRKAHRLTKVISKNDLTFSNTYENAIPASVLVLLFPFEKEIHVKSGEQQLQSYLSLNGYCKR